MNGLTQQKMADLIGVTYQQAHKYENGVNRIAAGRLYIIAQVLGVDVSYFFEGLQSASSAEPNPAATGIPGSRAQLQEHPHAQAPGGDLPADAHPGERGERGRRGCLGRPSRVRGERLTWQAATRARCPAGRPALIAAGAPGPRPGAARWRRAARRSVP
jgi:transcriptional regulator with XRE-family HTH domain